MDRQYSSKIEVKRPAFIAEWEKLLNHLEDARRMSEEVFLLIRQLDCVFEEIKFTQGESRFLKTKLNRTARQFGLQLIPEEAYKGPDRKAQ